MIVRGPLDEGRRHAESLGSAYYELTYGERQLHGLVETLIRRGSATVEELAACMKASR